MHKKGLLIVYTGNGKGKTTAALGLAMRAVGQGMKVSVIQFIKGTWKYGEMAAAKSFENLMDFHVMGKGFTWKSENIEEDKKAAREAWSFAKETILSAKHEMVILDEITYPVNYNMIDGRELVDTISARPEHLHIVVTGRDAPQSLIHKADLVTEMVEIKHPYKNGIKAQKGIEF